MITPRYNRVAGRTPVRFGSALAMVEGGNHLRPREYDVKLRNVPTRLATGAYIAHTGWDKWHGTEERAAAVHASAVRAYPALGSMNSPDFLRLLAAGELAVGAALLAPFVPTVLAGAALTAFSGGLVGMYLRTDDLHRPGSVWPTAKGIAVSKDVWMLGIGLGLVLDGIVSRDGA